MTSAPQKALAPSLFPIFLKLEGQRCLVVGAGDVAESKIAGLLEAAANVRVVAPEATPLVQSWAAAGQIDNHSGARPQGLRRKSFAGRKTDLTHG